MMELDAFIVPGDEHLWGYVSAYAGRLDWIAVSAAPPASPSSGAAALFIDGRYRGAGRMQAPAELFEFLHLVEDPHVQWLADQLPSGSQVSFDARLHSLAWYQNAKAVLTERGIELVRIDENPIDLHWAIVPPRPRALSSSGEAGRPVQPGQARNAGQRSAQARAGCGAADPGRGHQLAAQPAWSRRGTSAGGAGLCGLYAQHHHGFFVDTDKIDCFAFSQHVGQDVSVYPIDKLGDVLQRIGEDQQKVLADPNTANAWTQLVMEGRAPFWWPVRIPPCCPRRARTPWSWPACVPPTCATALPSPASWPGWIG